MKTSNRPNRRAGKLRAALLAVVIGGVMASGDAAAQWTVIDPAHIQAQLGEFAQQAARWGEQGQQWYKEYEQFMQQYNSLLSSIQNMRSAFALPPGTQMLKIDDPDTFMVEERCGPPYGGGVPGVLGQLTGFTVNDNPQVRRWQYCVGLQRVRNKQYNEVVEYLQETMPQMNAELDRAGQQFVGSGKTQGDMAAYAAKLDKVKGDVARANEEFNARMTAYNIYAQATELNLSTLTRSTLRGGSGLLQEVADAAVMYEALCGGGQCD